MCQCGYVGKGGIQTLNGIKQMEIFLLVAVKQKNSINEIIIIYLLYIYSNYHIYGMSDC